MKRIICVLLIALLCAGLAACGSKQNNQTASSGAQSTVESKADATESAASSAASSASSAASAKLASVQEYLDTPEVQAEINDTIKEAGDTIKIKVYAEGDTLVYDYQFTDHFDDSSLASVKESLDNSLEEKKESFIKVVTTLKTNVDVANPKVKVIYRNDDGNVITERTYE